MDVFLLVVLWLGLPTLLAVGLTIILARAGPRMRQVVIASVAACSAGTGLVDPLWGHRPTGYIFGITFFLVLPIIGAAVARDTSRVKAGISVLAITWTSYLLVSVVASGGRR